MKSIQQLLIVTAAAASLCLSGSQSVAQDNGNRSNRGNFDPSEWRQRRMNEYKDRLEIKDDTEWKAIQPLIEKVMDTQQAVMRDRMSGIFGSRGRSDRGDNNGGGGGDNGDRRRRGGFGGLGEPSPEADALQKAIDGKASNSEMKAVIAKFMEARKKKQADMEAAQAKLRAVLSVRQEAIATASGLL